MKKTKLKIILGRTDVVDFPQLNLFDIDIKIDENIKFPLKELDKIGKMIIYKNGQAVDELNLVVHEEVKKERLFLAVFRYIKDLLSAISSRIVTG